MKKALTMVLLSMACMLIGQQQVWAQKAKYQSVFIYNFCKYIQWPSGFNEGEFVIGTLGSGELNYTLEKMAEMKKEINGQPIRIEHFNTIKEYKNCHIIFLAEAHNDQFEELYKKIGTKPTILITESEGYGEKGATINFVELEGKIKFELNEKEANKKRLKIASQLKALAILI